MFDSEHNMLEPSKIDNLGSVGYNELMDRIILTDGLDKYYYRKLSKAEVQYDPYTIFRGADDMSFVCAYVARDGVVVASDTRRIVVDENERIVELYDDEQKIFLIPGTNILMAVTGGCRFGVQEEYSCADAIKNLMASDFRSLCLEVSDKIREFGVRKELLLAFYRPVLYGSEVRTKQCCIRMWENGDLLLSDKTVTAGAVFPQGSNLSKDDFDVSSIPCNMFVRDAIPVIKSEMVQVLDIARSRKSLISVGGRCDMYIARTDGVEHLAN